MTKPNPDAEIALHKLAQRIRQGVAQKHPVQEKTLGAIKDAIREEYEAEQQAKRDKDAASPQNPPTRQPEPPEPGADR
jgi:hypothetical protein